MAVINNEKDITMDNINNSFLDVIDYIDKLFQKNDVENAKKAIKVIDDLIKDNNTKVKLDDYTWNGGRVPAPNDRRDNSLHALAQKLRENNSKIQLIDVANIKKDLQKFIKDRNDLNKEKQAIEARKSKKTPNPGDDARLDDIVKKELPDVENKIKLYGEADKLKDYLDKNQIEFTRLTLKGSARTPKENAMYNDLVAKQNRFNELTEYSLSKEIDIVGDSLFRTAEVRKELSERNVTRDDYIRFYEIGKQAAEDELNKTQQAKKEVEKVIDFLENINIWGLDDTAIDDILAQKDPIKVTESMRLAFENAQIPQFAKDELHNQGIILEISDIMGAQRMVSFLKKFVKDTETRYELIENREFAKKENLQIFNGEIKKIEQEKRTIGINNGTIDIDAETDEEKALREKQIKITMLGAEDDTEKALIEEWNERIRRFHSHQKDDNCRYSFKDIVSGNVVQAILNFKTIEDYKESQANAKDGYKDDAKFLNLADYKTFLEITSLYDSASKVENAPDDFAFNVLMDRIDRGYIDVNSPEFYDNEFFEFLQDRNDPAKRDAAMQWIKDFMPEMQKYVDTYHGFTNEHAVKYSTWKTAGSTLKAMKPVSGNLPAGQKVKNGLENIGRFFFLRAPKFKDENGNKTIGQGIATTLIDLGVVGGVVATGIFGGIAGLAAWGAAYAAKGAVTLVNVARAKAEYKKYKDEIDSNLPILVEPSKAAKEVARKEYYRREYERTTGKKVGLIKKFTTAVHAKFDRLSSKKSRETEEKIVEERKLLSSSTLDDRKTAVKDQANKNMAEVTKHEQMRDDNLRKEALSSNTYNEIIKDSEKAEAVIDEVLGGVARNAAIHTQDSANYNVFRKDVNINSTKTTADKYGKKADSYDKINALNEVANEGGTVAATGITEEEIYTGRQQHQDFVNRVATALLAAGIRMTPELIKSIRAKEPQIIENTIYHPRKKEPEPQLDSQNQPSEMRVWHDSYTKQYPKYKDVTVKEFDPDKPISELVYGNEGYNDVYGYGGVLTHAGKGNKTIDAVAFAAKDKNGRTIELSLAELNSSLTQRHVQSLVNKDISNVSYVDIAEMFKKLKPDRYKEFCEAIGMDENTPIQDVVRRAAENGNIYGQSGDMSTAWMQLKDGFMKETTEKVFDGYRTEVVPSGFDVVKTEAKSSVSKAAEQIKDKVDTTVAKTTTTVVKEGTKSKTNEARNAFLKGLAAAGASTMPDTLHEANKQTKAETFAQRAARKRKEEGR